MILETKIALARAAGALSRRSGRGATSLPGKLLMRMEPRAIERLARRLPAGSAVISATNGKTTTAAMVAAILERGGTRLVHNRAGANMAGGVASELLGAARRGDGIDADAGLFEVDEFWLDRVVPQLQPRALLLANLFRDQLDRYGELETIADRWSAAVAAAPQTKLVLNADDPLVADLGRGSAPGRVTYFGVQDDAMALPGMAHASDSKHCRRCGAPYVYDSIYMGHMGHYHCPNGDSRRPQPDVYATDVTLDGTRGARFELHVGAADATVALPLPGLYNVYNALGAAALTSALGASLQQIVAGLAATQAAFGRAETVTVGGRELAILLVKNPAGANEVLRTLALDEGEHDVLAVLNDNIADGRDISWVWDADFEVIAERVRQVTCSGTRAAELALRLKYAGIAPARLRVVPGLERGLDAALGDGAGRLVALPTYTAMLALRELLVARGAAQGSFR
ncbi:MAG: proposed amino acid ligase found clustered with an amidotransferase [uncultured Solirubrobacteraceae bacterium]|uniref:Lipid II isoglutaminyl synthase (glutamine-hydrolyzing) subunit MurT n=1 Tax=uncultured Solirubrobacteraceae bacterium TaxID=1162706 RepID=A0A6J4SMH5_9ACTN|nr:MAG: proposed amino acid ligase found clustered with an amidotransferase [uncultured Solirubrobacteraceae bacterium]